MCPVWANRVARVVAAIGLIKRVQQSTDRDVGRSGCPAPADQRQLLSYAQNQQFWSRLGAADRALIDDKVDVIIEPEREWLQADPAGARGRADRGPVPQERRWRSASPGADGEGYRVLLDRFSTERRSISDASSRNRSITSYAIDIDWHDSTARAATAMEPNLAWTQSIAQWRFDVLPGGGTSVRATGGQRAPVGPPAHAWAAAGPTSVWPSDEGRGRGHQGCPPAPSSPLQ